MAIKTAGELVSACLDVAENYQTLYVMGCFGAPMTPQNKQRYCRNHSFNAQPERSVKIQAASANTFGFDCVCFIKGLLWGWRGDAAAPYGGAVYKSNGVPDISADRMIQLCADVSTDFSHILPGELVWQPEHVGIYIGDGKAVECTDSEADGVQIQAVLPMGTIDGLPATGWVCHGKLPWITYEAVSDLPRYRLTAENLDYHTAMQAANSLKKAGYSPILEETAPSPVPELLWIPAVQDQVFFHGNSHYGSANATSGKSCSSGEAIITRIVPGSKHPYHLVRTGKTGPYGWVDPDTFTKA